MSDRDIIGSATAMAVVLFGMLIAFVFATGSTFHQRCSRAYETGDAAWERCIARLENGGPVHEENIGRMPQ